MAGPVDCAHRRPTRADTPRRLLVSLAVVVAVVGCDAGPAPSPSTPAGGPSAPTPPAAILSTPEGAQKEGEVGSYTYRGAGTDTPWLPADALDPFTVSADEPLTVRLQDDVAASSATGAVAAADDREGAALRPVRIVGPLATGGFEVPSQPTGSWVLFVELVYADGSGSGAYYWHLDVR
jgi:hypothetical protein